MSPILQGVVIGLLIYIAVVVTQLRDGSTRSTGRGYQPVKQGDGEPAPPPAE